MTNPPRAKKQPVTETHHGIERTDNYAWLRASNWKQVLDDSSALPANIQRHLEAENEYQDLVMTGTEELQKNLLAEITKDVSIEDIPIAIGDGVYTYDTTYYDKRDEHPSYIRYDVADSEERLIIDGNVEAENHSFFDWEVIGWSCDH